MQAETKAEIKDLIEEAIELIVQIPTLDVDADEFNLSPEDAAGHVSGLVLRRLNRIANLLNTEPT